MATESNIERLGRLWGVLRASLSSLSVQGIRQTAGAAGFDVSKVPATSEAKSGLGSRAEVLPGLDKVFDGMQEEPRTRVLVALSRRLLENGNTVERTQRLLEEQGFRVVDGAVELDAGHSAADVDHLTGLANLRAFASDADRILREAATSGERFSLAVFDIDHFKKVNDDHGGHATGDEALVAVAQLSASAVRGKGRPYRLGGDEFALLLPNHTAAEALAVSERLRRAVAVENSIRHLGAAAAGGSTRRACADPLVCGRCLVRVYGAVTTFGIAVRAVRLKQAARERRQRG